MDNFEATCTVNNCTFIENSSGTTGGAMNNSQSDSHISNCTFLRNAAFYGGGGICSYLYLSNHPVVVNCSFISNKGFGAGNNAGGLYNIESSPEVNNCSFINNSAIYGGGVSNINSSYPIITNCTFSGNSALYYGGMNSYSSSSPTLTNCTFSGNSAQYGEGGLGSGNDCNVTLTDCTFSGNSAQYFGDIGTYNTGVIYLRGSSRIQGIGGMGINLGGEIVIDSNAVVDLNDPNDPNIKGTIQCDGLLDVKGNGQLKHATVNVSRQAGGYFGKFQVEDHARATNLNIYTDGDRFMDVNYSTFAGTIANNKIYVTITEGQNGSDEGIVELRGRDLPSHPCDFNEPNVLACQLDGNTMPAFDTNSWTLERLEVAPGAKVTLMDRLSSGNGSPEVLYAKNLVLGAGCSLNVGMGHLFYTNITGDANLIKRDAQFGFSLNEMNFNSAAEFQSRVGNNNYINPVDPNLNRIQVERITGLDLDPNGVMKMTNFEDPCTGEKIYARAKTNFASASEDKVRIQFNYLFDTNDPCVQIVVYLSDVPELLDTNDPCHYIEAGRVFNPSYPLPGSNGSGRFGDFDLYVDRGKLDLTNGTWVELELIEPVSGGLLALSSGEIMYAADSGEGSSSTIVANLNVKVSCYSCSVCLDLDSSCHVEPADFLVVVSGTGSADTPTCVDGRFSGDGYTDLYDAPFWDWTLNNPARQDPVHCGVVAPLCGSGDFPLMGLEQLKSGGSFNQLVLTDLNDLNDLLISGKRGSTDDTIKMKDRLYVFDSNSSYKQYIGLEPNDRCNFRVVRGQGSDLYLINAEKGLLRLDTGAQIVPPGQISYDGNDPRYNVPANVYAGIRGSDSDPYGRPILDAAFDASGFVYVVPVIVVPYGSNPPYAAAAKIQLSPYQVVKLYDGPVVQPNDNQLEYRNSLREIEVDNAGNVYVTNANKMNASDLLWKFEPGGTIRRLELDPCDPCSPRVRAPVGLCFSNGTNRIYVASSLRNDADPNATVIQGFSAGTLKPVRTIRVTFMQHVTGITEDPVTKSLWVTGFNFNSNPKPQPFYDPYLAKVPLGINEVNAICILDSNDLAMPLSITWTGALPPPKKCGGADLNGDGVVNFKDLAQLAAYWRFTNCADLVNCNGADLEPEQIPDGDVDLRDLDVMADNWLNTNCQ
jgi:hypothetical protein